MTEAEKSVARPTSFLRAAYDRCLAWVQTPHGVWAMFWLAVAESSFFPIPPDVFLMALCIAAPTKAYRFAAICTAGSVLGGALGYGLGLGFKWVESGPLVRSSYHAAEQVRALSAVHRQLYAMT